MKKQVFMALAGLIAVLLAVIGVLLVRDIKHDLYCTCDWNRSRSGIDLNEIEYSEEIIEIDDSTVAEGFIRIRLNDSADENKVYTALVYDRTPETEEEGKSVQAQFTIPRDWAIVDLPYTNNDIYVFEMSKEEYEKSHIETKANTKLTGLSETVGFVARDLKVVGRYAVNGAKTFDRYSRNNNNELYTQKTVWLSWNDDSPVVTTAKMLRQQNPTNDEFRIAAISWIRTNIAYDHDKANNVKIQNCYDMTDVDEVFEQKKGVCSDMAAMYTVMCRSQGIPCVYVSGLVNDVNGNLSNHAWNMILNDAGNWVWADPTLGDKELGDNVSFDSSSMVINYNI